MGLALERLLFIADSTHAPDPALLAAEAARAGVRWIELRRPRPPGGAPESALRLDEVKRAVATGSCVIVNDRVDLAILGGAAGAHVGQEDLPPAEARRLLGRDRLLGLSTHDVAQVTAADGLPLDYVAVGPVFQSSTKAGHAAVLGLEGLMACFDAACHPVVAIGGIEAGNVHAVLDAGAAAACVGGAIGRGDVAASAAAMLAAVRSHEPLPVVPAGAEAIVLSGPPGSGKSTVGRHLATRLGLPFTDLDEAVAGPAMAELLAAEGEAGLRRREAGALRRLLTAGPMVVALGGGTLLGAHSRVLVSRSRARVVRLVVPAGECLARLAGAPPRPLLEAARVRGAGALAEHLAERAGSHGLDVDGLGAPQDVARRIETRLASTPLVPPKGRLR